MLEDRPGSYETSSIAPEEKGLGSVTHRRLSRPEPGRSLGGTVTKVERPIRLAVQHLGKTLSTNEDLCSKIFDCTFYGPGGVREPNDLRLTWFVVSVVLMHALANRKKTLAKTYEALQWFFGNQADAASIINCFHVNQIGLAEKVLVELLISEEFWDLLPYVLEPHGHVTRNGIETCEVARNTRLLKKESGIYYTPSDVAEFMVRGIMPNDGRIGTWIDPACGTGVFLRTVLRRIRYIKPPAKLTVDELVVPHIFGADRSALATDLAAFVVLGECLPLVGHEQLPFAAWQHIKRNIVCIDALRLVPRHVQLELHTDSSQVAMLGDVFPSIGDIGFDHIVMNPPYAATTVDNNMRSLWHSFGCIPQGQTGDTHLAFTEMVWRLVNDSGSAAAVLPISIGTNTTKSYNRLREELLNSSGTKEFLFFDREPQALFGEDIKTRNVVLFLHKSKTERDVVCTSRLLKWTAEQRPTIFTRDRLTKIGIEHCQSFIPKLGSAVESRAYTDLRRLDIVSESARFAPKIGRMSFNDVVNSTAGDRQCMVLVSGTAYNFVNCFFGDALPQETPYPYSSSLLNTIALNCETDAFAAFALLSSRLCYWLWHVEGDGFHLTGNFLKRLPLWASFASTTARQNFANYGAELWSAARASIVATVNGGRQTYSFHCDHTHPTLKKIEDEIASTLGLDTECMQFLDEFVEAVVSIDGKRRTRKFEVK